MLQKKKKSNKLPEMQKISDLFCPLSRSAFERSKHRIFFLHLRHQDDQTEDEDDEEDEKGTNVLSSCEEAVEQKV